MRTAVDGAFRDGVAAQVAAAGELAAPRELLLQAGYLAGELVDAVVCVSCCLAGERVVHLVALRERCGCGVVRVEAAVGSAAVFGACLSVAVDAAGVGFGLAGVTGGAAGFALDARGSCRIEEGEIVHAPNLSAITMTCRTIAAANR